MPLRDLSRRHAVNPLLSQHEENVFVERFINPLTDVLNIGQQVLKIQIDVISRAHNLRLRRAVNKNSSAGNDGRGVILHIRREQNRRITLIINRLRLSKLLLLQLP